jgi:hypothetical protein
MIFMSKFKAATGEKCFFSGLLLLFFGAVSVIFYLGMAGAKEPLHRSGVVSSVML